MCSFQGMVWDDSYTSNKCTSVAGLLFAKVCEIVYNYLLWNVSHSYSMQMPSGFFTADMYSTLFLQVLCVSNDGEKG